MPEDRIAVVRAYFDALGRKDIAGALDMLDPDFEFDYSRSRGPQQGIHRGRDQLERFYDNFLDAFSEVEPYEVEIVDVGGRVLRVGGFRARGKGSGIEARAGGATVWVFRDGRPVAAALFQSKEDALEALGSG